MQVLGDWLHAVRQPVVLIAMVSGGQMLPGWMLLSWASCSPCSAAAGVNCNGVDRLCAALLSFELIDTKTKPVVAGDGGTEMLVDFGGISSQTLP